MNNSDNKMKFETPNFTVENVAYIANFFPGVVTEGKVNFDLLRSMLGDEVFGDEAYEFTWVGKRAAIAEAGRPIRKTLRPCKDESRDWDTTENLYIEGDNLDVLKLLQESYLGKVKMVYIDPPYNTGNDFIYHDDFAQNREEYDKEAGVYDEDGDRLFKNTETNGRFHSDWCSMMYPRLVLARNLLSSDGAIFISIDDNEVAQLRKICDEVFGESNFVAQMIWQKKTGASDAVTIATITEYVTVYAKNIVNTKLTKNTESYDLTRYKYQDKFIHERGAYYIDNLDRGGLQYSDSLNYGIECPDGTLTFPNGRTEYVNDGWTWKWSKQKIEWARQHGFIEFRKSTLKSSGWAVCYKNYLLVDNKNNPIERAAPHKNLISNILNANAAAIMKNLFGTNRYFDYAKPVELLKHLVSLVKFKDNDIILDFFSGSATTAHAVMQFNAEDGGNRKFIMVQLPEITDEKSEAHKAGYKNICEIGKERIRRAGDKIKEENKDKLGIENLDTGFRVLKLDDTNMNDVYYAAGDYTQDRLIKLENNIKVDRTDMDLLFGCLLDWGLPLSMPHSHEKIDGFTVHTYNDGDLIACFEGRISEKAVREIADRKPLRVVFRDSSFTSSPEKINVFEIFKLLAPNTTVKVI